MAALPEANSPGLSGRDLVPLARVDFLVFIVLMFPELHDGKRMIPAPYVEVIVEGLMNARSGGPNRRLIFNLPPGHMKSLLISILFHRLALGREPVRTDHLRQLF